MAGREDAGYKPVLSLSQGLRYRRRLGVAVFSSLLRSSVPSFLPGFRHSRAI